MTGYGGVGKGEGGGGGGRSGVKRGVENTHPNVTLASAGAREGSVVEKGGKTGGDVVGVGGRVMGKEHGGTGVGLGVRVVGRAGAGAGGMGGKNMQGLLERAHALLARGERL